MKRILLSCLIVSTSLLCNATEIVFTSSDPTLEKTFRWATHTALGYSHDGNDPVGYWYEAALPQREAFCMRDVSHQSVGAQILGLAKHNADMFTHFAENISEQRDWCTYWEINRYNLPAPADYTNDHEFWYNLNANFDFLQACLKLYRWTGDSRYLNDSRFTNFYRKSVKEYVERWMLSPEAIMNRPRYMNQPVGFDPENNFHTCRGLASYVENFRNLTVSADLLASLFAGYEAYAQICLLKGDKQEAERQQATALGYRNLLEAKWWNRADSQYFNFYTSDQKFYYGEGTSYLLWFAITSNPDRIRHTVRQLLDKDWNVETLSYFPTLLYRLGYNSEAYHMLTTLPQQERANYPEVSFGIIEGMVVGMMGIQPKAEELRVSTMSHLTDKDSFAEMKNIPVFGGFIHVRHEGKKVSRIENHTGKTIYWRATFAEKQAAIYTDKNKKLSLTSTTDMLGNPVSYVDIKVADGVAVQVSTIQ